MGWTYVHFLGKALKISCVEFTRKAILIVQMYLSTVFLLCLNIFKKDPENKITSEILRDYPPS